MVCDGILIIHDMIYILKRTCLHIWGDFSGTGETKDTDYVTAPFNVVL